MLHLVGVEANLSEQRGLLVAQYPRNGDFRAEEIFWVGRAVILVVDGESNFRQHLTGNSELFKKGYDPTQVCQCRTSSPGSVSHVGHMLPVGFQASHVSMLLK